MKNSNQRFAKTALFPLLLIAIGLAQSFLLLKLPFFSSLGSFALPATSVIAGLLVAVLFSYPIFAIYQQRSVAVAIVFASLVAVWRILIMGRISSDPVVLFAWAADLISLGFLPSGVFAVSRMSPNKSFKPNSLRESA
jgi:hypothetical protein